MDDADLGAALDDLFDQPPEDFVGARNALVRTLKGASRKEEAKDVGALRRPSRTAWALNRLARSDADAVSGLLDAADAVRGQQTAGGSALREATADLRSATRRATDAAIAALGATRPSDHADVSAALLAVLSDETALAALPEGRLSEVPAVGLGAFGGGAVVAPARPKPATKVARAGPDADAVEQARLNAERAEALHAARTANDAAETARAEADREAEAASEALAATQDRLDSARTELAEAEEAHATATDAAKHASAAAAAASSSARGASQALADLE